MRFAVVGDPVAHSRSPAMHTAGYRHLGIDATYELLPTSRGAFAEVVRVLRCGELNGVNVTMPHKHNAFDAADTVEEVAVPLHAVNTLVVRDGTIWGYNTDIDGVNVALERLGRVSGVPVHVLGSGGAAAAAVLACSSHGDVSISARSMEKADRLRERLAVAVEVRPWGVPVPGSVLVNATPLGMHGEPLPEHVLSEASGLVDMPYGPDQTPAVLEAARLGIPSADGLVMLAGQASRAFELFTGRSVPVEVFEHAGRRF